MDITEISQPQITQVEYPSSDLKAHRQTATALRLIADAAGGPSAWAGKLRRVGRTVRTVLDRAEVRRRIERLRATGMMEAEPTRLQLFLLGADMLRYFIEPGARDYYASRGIHFGLHQLLRVLDDPSSMMDPVGLLSSRDTIIGHVLQVVHANPIYDFQLLEMFEDGMEQMESQTAAMIDGTHPRAQTIGAVVEDPEYHARLLEYIRRYRRDPNTPELRRRARDARSVREFVLAEETFGNMPAAFRYACRLPTTLSGAVAHLARQKTLAPSLCDARALEATDAFFARAISA